ncbi:MAG: glycoside hydrolase family 2 protein [Clostridiales bacterium]|nr:glycoside hydrolase family 2 protein [Clostridiales bacterium]
MMEKFSLNGKWEINSNTYHTVGEVPGSVYSALLDNGLMDDPFYRDNEKTALAVMDEEFVFSKTFTYHKPSDCILLVCEGIDTLCDLYLNGKKVAHLENMHRAYEFDVTEYLVDGENTIKAVFPPYDAYIKEKTKEKCLPNGSSASMVGFGYVRKAFYMSGWDWGPMLPDAGIWKDIYLIDGTLPRITDVRITQRHEGEKVFVTATALSSRTAELRILFTTPEGRAFPLENGVEQEVANPQLWWPNGYGKQPLYTLTVECFHKGKSVDKTEKKIGLRTLIVSREKDEWGEEFCYKINGVKIFAMGADYIPEDNILSRLSRSRTEKLLQDCLFANFNSIRVWGGGFYPHDYFFELCDEMGIIVFIDLMFACTSLPRTQAFYENVKEEISQNLKRIRHHACIGVISGNNEIEEQVCYLEHFKEERQVYLELFEEIIPEIVKRECPEISFVPSSPSSHGKLQDPTNENVGDCHYWSVWHGNMPFTEYRNHYFRFLSEFGFQSFPSIKTIEQYTLPEDRNPFSPVMELHQRNAAANGKILSYLSQTYLYPTRMENLAYASQLLQAEAIKYGVEHLRRNRGRCMGALYWQLNDCWPVASWSSVDGYGRYKALHYEAKRFFEPIHISCEETGEYSSRWDITAERFFGYETKARLVVNNDTIQEVSGTVSWELRDNTGAVLQSGKAPLSVGALSYAALPELDFNKTDPRNHYVSFSFTVNGTVLSCGTALFTKPKHFNFINPNLQVSVSGDEITVTADTYAKYVYISNETDDLVLSDNFFDMNAGKKTVKILSGKATNLTVKSVYDVR